jgi:hypothetical protein
LGFFFYTFLCFTPVYLECILMCSMKWRIWKISFKWGNNCPSTIYWIILQGWISTGGDRGKLFWTEGTYVPRWWEMQFGWRPASVRSEWWTMEPGRCWGGPWLVSREDRLSLRVNGKPGASGSHL